MNHRMWRGLWMVAALTLCVCVTTHVRADEEAAEVSGSWKLAIQVDDVTSLTAVIDLGKNDEGFGGHFNMEDGMAEADLTEVNVDGASVSFKIEADMGGQTLIATFKGKVEGDKFTGSVDYDLGGAPGTLDVAGDRILVVAAGAWNFELTTPDGATLKPTLVVSTDGDSVSGEFVDEDGNGAAPDSIALDGNTLTFQTTTDYGGATVVSKWTGTVRGDELNGTLVYELEGQTGEIEFTGVRAPAVAEGTWKLAISTPDGLELTPRLNVTKNGDALAGTFLSDDGSTVDATDLSLDAGKLTWGTLLDFGGQELKADWSAAVQGDKLSGTVAYDLGGQVGELEFSGARSKIEAVATWTISVTTEDGQALESKLELVKVDGELGGKYIGITGEEVEMKNLTQDGDKLAFEFSADIGGETLSGKFDGTVDGDKYTGTVSYELAGQPGELPFEATKASDDDGDDDADDDADDDDGDDDADQDDDDEEETEE